uniref:Uncharacterized protein n=1 Tax=Photinus pyralis TaxID=7054 RepID=A0A1Y1M910_PHOPY
MELDANLIWLQTELRALGKDKDLKKIKYIGGNEDRIDGVVNVIRIYSTKSYLSTEKKKRLQFLQLLFLNTNTENDLSQFPKESQHLVKVIPTLSTCLLACIVLNTNLLSDYCELMKTFPLSLNKELLFELQICLTNCNLKKTLQDTSLLLKALIELFQVNEMDNKIMQGICHIANEMLKNIVYFNTEKALELTSSQLQEHMGHCILKILQIINLCPPYQVNVCQFLEHTVNVATKLMKAVTVNVFCIWAQVKCECGTPLQLVVAEESFCTIDHLKNYEPAACLIDILSTIARKPKPLNDKVLEADLSDIIFQINRGDENQLVWFRALINTQLFKDENAVKCLKKWYHLCTADDVLHLLDHSSSSDDRAVVLKCANALNVSDLKNVIIKHFWKHTNIWKENIGDEFTMFLNKFDHSDDIRETKRMLLFSLQNREYMLQTLYEKCLMKRTNINKYKIIFNEIKDIMDVNSFSTTIFANIMQSNLPKDENIVCYRELLSILLELQYFSDGIVNKIFGACLLSIEGDDCTLATLTLFNTIPVNFRVIVGQEDLVFTLLFILEKYRQEFDILHLAPAITQQCTDLLCKFSKDVQCLNFGDRLSELPLTHINKYYASKFYSSSEDTFLKFIYHSETTSDYVECAAKLINLLPICVKSEWMLITNEILERFGYVETLNLYSQVMFLISQLKENVERRLVYCLQLYTIILKDILQPKYNTLTEEQTLAKQICRLLKNIPPNIRENEAIRLTGLLTNNVLKSLKGDREFILLLISIQDTGVSQLLAQRMLE